jgi:hypothetical protein
MINSRTTFVALHFKRQTKIILIKGVGCRKLTLIKRREKKYGKEEDLSSDFCIYREISSYFTFIETRTYLDGCSWRLRVFPQSIVSLISFPLLFQK